MNQSIPPNEVHLLEEMKRALAEQLRFFSNPAKPERERWIVNEFLVQLGISFLETDLKSPPQSSKVDVEFHDALFQIKEISDPNVKRGQEIKTAYKKVSAAMTLQDTVGPGFVYDVPAPASGYELIKAEASNLAEKAIYRNHKSNLDLLFYVTRTRTSLISIEQQRLQELATVGWRSISCLMGTQATVIYAAATAPAFLRAAVQ